ncbi:hypothetical protein AVEN_193351-1 [Araneus ventricosus]|uniref:Uncharacterized protein n=1 Tax=Araneus ventricosus TaxID=182803 RepID=A0A4Y2EQV6_ARAVE|nr:hypothetical protein AVEN_193351-1 [Araneus ventricosus]
MFPCTADSILSESLQSSSSEESPTTCSSLLFERCVPVCQLLLSKKQAELKKDVKKAKRNSFGNTCTKTPDPYGRQYKTVIKNKHPQAELFKQLGDPSSEDAKSFALKILQELYPPSQSPVPPPNCLPPLQQHQIIKNKINRIRKKAPTKKAPGFDAIDYIVLKKSAIASLKPPHPLQ